MLQEVLSGRTQQGLLTLLQRAEEELPLSGENYPNLNSRILITLKNIHAANHSVSLL